MDALAFTSSNFVRSKRHIIEPRNWRKMGAISLSKETESPILSFPFGGSLSRNSLCQCAESKHHQVCLRWGADGKVRQLEQLHPQLSLDKPIDDSTSTILTPVKHLDLATVIKVSEAVSGEIVCQKSNWLFRLPDCRRPGGIAREYLALVDGLSGLSARDFLLRCAILLPQLYSLSHQLPDIVLPEGDPLEGKEDARNPPMANIMNLLGKYDLYSEVFDPVSEEGAIKATLSDDLSDIYMDLKRGLSRYDDKEQPNQPIAVWEWKFNMKIHWGHHLVGALRPIHSLVYDHLDPEFLDKESDLVR